MLNPHFSQNQRSLRLKALHSKDLSEVVTLLKKRHCVKKTVAENKREESREKNMLLCDVVR
jgi:hypothetical protein